MYSDKFDKIQDSEQKRIAVIFYKLYAASDEATKKRLDSFKLIVIAKKIMQATHKTCADPTKFAELFDIPLTSLAEIAKFAETHELKELYNFSLRLISVIIVNFDCESVSNSIDRESYMI